MRVEGDLLDGVQSVLVVGAHAFDAEVMAGPLAATASTRGFDVTLLHLSLGEQGHPRLPPAEYVNQKRREAIRSSQRLGVHMETFEWPDAFVPSDDHAALAVCDVIRRTRADAVITHWHGSWHKDHRAANRCTLDGLLYASLPTLQRADPPYSPSLILFGENWEDADGFVPDVLIDVSNGIEPWRQAVREYELGRGLTPFNYYDYYSSLYRLRGCLAYCAYAQGFRRQSEATIGGVSQVLRGAREPAAVRTASAETA